MKDNRTVRCSFVKRLGAERQWNTLYRLLLELGSKHLPAKDPVGDRASAPSFCMEVSDECRRLCPRVDATAS